MRKFLIGALIIIVLALAAMVWLGTQAEKGKPADGEIRMEIENVL